MEGRKAYSLDDTHLAFVGCTSTLGVGSVSIAVSSVGVFIASQDGGFIIAILELLADRCIQARNVLLQEGTDGLTDEFRRHLEGTRLVLFLVSPGEAVVSRGLVFRMRVGVVVDIVVGSIGRRGGRRGRGVCGGRENGVVSRK